MTTPLRTCLLAALLATVLATVLGACGGDDDNDADTLGIGAQCTASDQCLQEGDAIAQTCLTQFKGGYCGLSGCTADVDCPELSACVTHDEDGLNYCFRTCLDKPECNENRDLENEANCSGSATFVDGTMGRKACIPPSSGV